MCDVRLCPEQLTHIAPLDPSSDRHHLRHQTLMTVIISWDRRLSQAIQVVKGRDSISVALTQNRSPEPTFSLPVGGQTDEGLHSERVGLPLLQGLAHGHLGSHKKVLVNRLSLQAETNFHERQFVGPK